jgi:hypothetical protein
MLEPTMRAVVASVRTSVAARSPHLARPSVRAIRDAGPTIYRSPPARSADGLSTLLRRSVDARAVPTKTVRGEEVNIVDATDEAQAERIMSSIASNYAITFDSGRLVTATRRRYSQAPAAEIAKIQKRSWNVRELRVLERACQHFAPILGKARATSSPTGSWTTAPSRCA